MVGDAAADRGRVAGHDAVADGHLSAGLVVDAAAVIHGSVARHDAVCQRQDSLIVDAAAVNAGRVPRHAAVRQRQRAAVHNAAAEVSIAVSDCQSRNHHRRGAHVCDREDPRVVVADNRQA